ncbi:hypothetical protein QVD17_15129 [Tagetes erecta]|uniref:Uncharacterized protein n=1 Tax=Tagetes erecta TaxID=13708 RepID=A0AAD8KP48_TARER|nr:hypothetical protein QVD17_15129 [Tagetes erecta]
MSSPPPNTTENFLKSVAQQRPPKHSHPSIYQTQTQTFQNPQLFNSISNPPQFQHHPSFSHLQQTTLIPASANPKVVGQSSVAAKNGDDAFVIIRDRKVQVCEGTSLYSQCRSWLKNGITLENQPQYLDCVKSLPKPLPASMAQAEKKDDIEIEEETQDVDNMSAKDLLQQHVKHAKKVRARLRNQRLQRIERYKDRLALLLPPVVDQERKNDPAT